MGRAFVVCMLAISSVSLASAQTSSKPTRPKIAAITGTLTGEVGDKRGTPLAGTAVTAMNIESKESESSTTDAGGIFRIDALAPGEYEVTYSAKNFAPQTQKAKIKPGKTTKIHARLKFMSPSS